MIIVVAMVIVTMCSFGIVGGLKRPTQETSEEQGPGRYQQPEGEDHRVTNDRQ